MSNHLEPTYLRYIYDGLLKGSIHPENAAELPDGLIGLYDEAFDERISVVERQKLLQRFAIWALLKKEVSAAFVAEILIDSEDDIQDFISTYSSWFNSPESGKYQLYHERLKVYLLQKLSEGEIHELHEKLIVRLEQAIAEQKADEFEWYGLEFLSAHLAVSCFNKRIKKLFDRFTEYALNDSFHNRQIEISSQYEWTFNLLQLAQYSTIVLRNRDVELINVKIIGVNEYLQSSIHDIIQLTREGNYNIALVRINSLSNHSENEVKTKLRLILLILTDIAICRNSKDLLDRNFISDILQIFDLESNKYKIDVFDIISPNIYFQIVLFLKESSVDYKYLLNTIIFDWGFSGISKIMTSDFIEFFLRQNNQNYCRLEELFYEIRELAYNGNNNINNSSGNYMYQGAIGAIDCMLISILLKLDPKRLDDFVKNSFKDFLETFSHSWTDSWVNQVMCYLQVDSIVELLHGELFSDENQIESSADNVNIKRKLELINSILLKIHLSKCNSIYEEKLFEYSEILLSDYFKITSEKSELEKKLEFFDLLILISINKNEDVNLVINPITELLNVDSDDFVLNQITRSLYFFEFTEQISKFIKFYIDDNQINRANSLIIEQSFNQEQIEKIDNTSLDNLIYKLEIDLQKKKLSNSSMYFIENLHLFFSNFFSDKSDGYYEQHYWEQCLQLIVNFNLNEYVELYINDLLTNTPDLLNHIFYYLVDRPDQIKNRLHKQSDKINLLNLEIALLTKDKKKQNDQIYKLLINNEKNLEIQWNFDSSDIFRYAKLKLEKNQIQDAINCISKVEVSSRYFVELIFEISIKLFQKNEEINFAIDLLGNVKYHFDCDEYDHYLVTTTFHSYYHIENGKRFLDLIDGLLNKILSCSQLSKVQFIDLLKNIGVLDDNITLLLENIYTFSFTKKIKDKELRSIIGDLLKQNNLLEKPIQFSINRGIPNILIYELSDSDIESIINELNEYSNYYWGQDFFPDYNEFFKYIGLTKTNVLNPIHKRNISNLKIALIEIGISKHQPIYSFCKVLISNFKESTKGSLILSIFPEFENKTELTEYLHEICLKIKQSRNVYLKDFYHFTFLTENTNRDDLIKELFQKRRFKPKKHLVQLFYLDDFTRRKFLVSFYNNISNFYNSEINWYLVYHLCRSDYNLLKHFNSERIKILLMQGKIPKKLSNLVTDKKEYLSEINKLNNLSVDLI